MEKIRLLLKLFENFQISDIFGFAKILEVEEKKDEDFLDYITRIAAAFEAADRKTKRHLLKLAKDISSYNKMEEKKNDKQKMQ